MAAPRRSRWTAAPILIAVVALTVFSSRAAAQTTGVILKEAPLYLYPQKGRGPLLLMEAGVEVEVHGMESGWLKVTVDGSRWGRRTGYVDPQLVEVLKPEPPPAGPAAPAPVAVPTQIAPIGAKVAPAPATTGRETATTEREAIGTRPSFSAAAVRGAAHGKVFSDQQIAANIQTGLRGKGRDQGLRLVDAAQRFFAALGSSGTGATASNGFTLSAYTPLAWVRQLASEAAKEYRPFTPQHVTDEMLEPVFRVVVYPDTPNTVTAAGMRGTSSVQHVVLRDEAREYAVQPTSKETFVEEVSNALGGRASFEGLRVKFSMDDVRQLRGRRSDREFFITVIGTTGEEKNFKVKRQHFDDLP